MLFGCLSIFTVVFFGFFRFLAVPFFFFQPLFGSLVSKPQKTRCGFVVCGF